MAGGWAAFDEPDAQRPGAVAGAARGRGRSRGRGPGMVVMPVAAPPAVPLPAVAAVVDAGAPAQA
eukprot:15436425-Heterocapsa_arctica.AAC.1